MMFFFFQAEDGIRDSSTSRGLGDVYKRQEIPKDVHFQNEEQILKVDQVRFARKASEIDRVFMAYISGKDINLKVKVELIK